MKMLPRFNPLTALLCVTAITATSHAAVIFSESFGTIVSTTLIAAHQLADGFDNPLLDFSGTGDLRATTISSGYVDASGGANVFLTPTTPARTLEIGGISTVGVSAPRIDLSFGGYKSNTASTFSELTVEFSLDLGATWTPLAVPPQPIGTGTTGWRSIEIEDTGIPTGAASVSLRFTNTAESGPQFRLDDIELSTVPEPSVALLGGLGLLALVRRRR